MSQEIQEVPTVGKKALTWLAVVCVVLLIAVGVLGQMWVSEQNQRINAQLALRKWLLAQEADVAAGRMGPALDPQSLPRRDVVMDGQVRQAILIGAQRGRQLGLEGDDVLVVLPEPGPVSRPGGTTTQP